MKKWLWRILLGVSSCLLLWVCILWTRSLSQHDGCAWDELYASNGNPVVRQVRLHSFIGRLWMTENINLNPPRNPDGSVLGYNSFEWIGDSGNIPRSVEVLDYTLSEIRAGWLSSHGFHFHQNWYFRHQQSIRVIAVPHWFLIAIFSIPLLIEIVRRFRRRRRKQIGLCQTCGYDLRASVDRCPECGTVIAPAASAPIGSDPAAG